MRNIASRSFTVTLYATGALIVFAIAITVWLELEPPSTTQLPLLNFELDLFKTLLAGFVVSMLGILIPAVGTEARQRFEQRKESRVAYSNAKTGIDYLKLRLATANLTEAAAAVQNAHFHKHQAELFDEFPEWLKKRYESHKGMTPHKWDLMMYGRLFGTRQLIEQNAAIWNDLSPAERISLLDEALPTESEIGH